MITRNNDRLKCLIGTASPAMAGTENGREYSGYPVFNTPDSSVHAIAQTGFSVANFNSNHSWDQGEYGIERTQQLFAQHPEVMLVGSYENDYARENVHLVERNGARIAFLSYAYGDNMYGANPASFPNQYYSCELDRDRMRTECVAHISTCGFSETHLKYPTRGFAAKFAFPHHENTHKLNFAPPNLADCRVFQLVGVFDLLGRKQVPRRPRDCSADSSRSSPVPETCCQLKQVAGTGFT